MSCSCWFALFRRSQFVVDDGFVCDTDTFSEKECMQGWPNLHVVGIFRVMSSSSCFSNLGKLFDTFAFAVEMESYFWTIDTSDHMS
uniref:Uncharacterized protein n=1 Tax=Arundo donax TaxID=35708 RepID=A0A0A9BVC1_ARUDO